MSPAVAAKGAVATYAMTPVELRASFSLASIFALRMLGDERQQRLFLLDLIDLFDHQ